MAGFSSSRSLNLPRVGLLERPVQRGARELLEMHGFRAVHIPNGAWLAGTPKQRAMQMAQLKKDGLAEGFPDLAVFGKRERQIGFMECKREIGGRLSQEQKGWRDYLQGQGFLWALVEVPGDAIAAVIAWGWLRGRE